MAPTTEVHIHIHPTGPDPVHFYFTDETGSVTRKLDELITHLSATTAQGAQLMATVGELKAKLEDVRASVEAETDLSKSIVTWMQGEGSIVADLKAQLAAALAAGGDQSEALQDAVNTLTLIQETNDANAKAVADAMIANTPSARR